ncbi:MAG: 2-amino-4-hydroxy-6-hydroxymethyldihydropteridine diphosphokinase [Pacificimonas sp.]
MTRKEGALAIIIALGSNRPHGRHGAPVAIIMAAMTVMQTTGMNIVRCSRIDRTRPLGPSSREYANAVVAVRTAMNPEQLLRTLHSIEHQFGRKRQRRWGARVLDLDLVAYHQEVRGGPDLYLPHPEMAVRRFVLAPMMEVAPGWRHPILNLTVRQMYARLTARR